jgi:hypothetical protein
MISRTIRFKKSTIPVECVNELLTITVMVDIPIGATTFSRMSFSRMTFSRMTFSRMTFSRMTQKIGVLLIMDCSSKSHSFYIVMLSAILPSVILLNVKMPC